MVKRLCIAVILILFCSEGIYSVVYADSAAVLPKGRSGFNLDYTNYLTPSHRYSGDGGKKGNIEDVATDFNTDIDTGVFPDLAALLNPPVSMTAPPNLGRTYIDFELSYSTLYLSYQYGITDKLSAGVRIPYVWSKNEVSGSLDTTNATVGKNSVTGTFFPLPGFSANPATAFTVPLTTNDMKAKIDGGLDINGDGVIDPTNSSEAGLGYRWFKTWQGQYFGDPEVGFRYQYLKTMKWRLAANLGAGFPTGPIDDPDNLVDFHFFTYGTYRLLFALNNDFTGIKNNVINTTLRYTYFVQQQNVELRITSDPNVTISTDKERVRRKFGDYVELEISDKYTPFKGFDISALYNFGFKYKNDRVSGDMGFAYESLERETAEKNHIIIIGLSYSTVPLYMEKKFPIPFAVNLSYRNKFAGRNNTMKSQYIKFGLSFYF